MTTSGSGTLTPSPTPKLRADAEANRVRIIAAAKRLFAQRGLDVTLDDVAHEAGVGVGTVYRRFANKQELVDGVFVDKFETVAMRACASNTIEDPLDALVDVMNFACEEFAGDRGFGALAMGEFEPSEAVRDYKAKLEAAVGTAITRAQQAEVVRPDLATSDFVLAFTMVVSVAEMTEETAPGTWRRAAAFLVDGIRADGCKTQLAVPPLTDEQLVAVHEKKHELTRRRGC